jgi:hypothetical protein
MKTKRQKLLRKISGLNKGFILKISKKDAELN